MAKSTLKKHRKKINQKLSDDSKRFSNYNKKKLFCSKKLIFDYLRVKEIDPTEN
jgi:hypothetical protein